jgi:hypothetical protein
VVKCVWVLIQCGAVFIIIIIIIIIIINQSSSDSAVNQLKSLNLAIPNKLPRKSKFPCWFSGTLKHYINKKNHYFHRFKKTNSDKHYFYFAHFHKLVKITIKTDRR